MNGNDESMEIKNDSSMRQDASVSDVHRVLSARQTLSGRDLMKVLALTALLGLIIGVIVLIELANR